jgi:uncharacterized protein YegP (UPF0339 family)
MWFELYEDSSPTTRERWRWRLMESDSAVLACSACGHQSEGECRLAVERLLIWARAPIRTRHKSVAFRPKNGSV